MILVKQIDGIEELRKLEIVSRKTPFFQSGFCLDIFSRNFCREEDLIFLGLFENDTLVGYGGFEKVDDKILFLGMKPVLGGEEVTDYGDVVIYDDRGEKWQGGWQKILEWFRENNFKKIQLDYVKADSETFRIFNNPKDLLGMTIKITEQEVAPYIELPATWDLYLTGMDHKRRKELKRKIKRLEETSSFHFCKEETVKEDFEEFVRLHRLSDAAKEKFMSEKMKTFFWDLIKIDKVGYETSLCFLTINNKNVASVMSFEDSEEVLLYNSGYDPDFDFYSVGFVLKAFKIKKAIEKGKKKYDFMRGNERYKYDLGGKDLKLYKVEINI